MVRDKPKGLPRLGGNGFPFVAAVVGLVLVKESATAHVFISILVELTQHFGQSGPEAPIGEVGEQISCMS